MEASDAEKENSKVRQQLTETYWLVNILWWWIRHRPIMWYFLVSLVIDFKCLVGIGMLTLLLAEKLLSTAENRSTFLLGWLVCIRLSTKYVVFLDCMIIVTVNTATTRVTPIEIKCTYRPQFHILTLFLSLVFMSAPLLTRDCTVFT